MLIFCNCAFGLTASNRPSRFNPFPFLYHRPPFCHSRSGIVLNYHHFYHHTLSSTLSRSWQLISFSIAALFSGVSFVRWMKNPDKSQMWDHLGTFCLIVFSSSLIGAVSIILAIKMFDFHYESRAPGISPYQFSTLTSTSFRFRAAWIILFQVQVFLGNVSKMLLLARLSSNAAQRVRSVSESNESNQSGLILGIKKNFIAKAGLSLPTTYRSVSAILGSFRMCRLA